MATNGTRHCTPWFALRRWAFWLLALLALSASCGSDQAAVQEADAASPDALAECAALAGPSPRTIEDVVAQLNRLPKPTTLACYLASLPRPLFVVATSSPFSLQPAEGPLSPRIFILTENLILSVVPSGPGSELLELGELVAGGRTVKGELHFPLEGEVKQSAPYVQVLETEHVTRCAICHEGEAQHPTRAQAFISKAYRPREDVLVPFRTFESIRNGCDEAEGSHCAIMRALFDYGAVLPTTFPANIDTFF